MELISKSPFQKVQNRISQMWNQKLASVLEVKEPRSPYYSSLEKLQLRTTFPRARARFLFHIIFLLIWAHEGLQKHFISYNTYVILQMTIIKQLSSFFFLLFSFSSKEGEWCDRYLFLMCGLTTMAQQQITYILIVGERIKRSGRLLSALFLKHNLDHDIS